MPDADHYVVAGFADVVTPGAPATAQWATIAAALRAFVREDDAALAPLCCASADEAAALCARAPPHTCAQRTLDALAGPVAPAVDAAMARGLRRWFDWTGKAPSAELEARLTGSKE